MIDLNEKIKNLHNNPSDINEHIPVMVQYGSECKHITEMGVRWIVSTWAWLAAKPKKLISYDIQSPSRWKANLDDVYIAAKEHNIDFQFKQENVLDITIEPTDLLFIDTWHTYNQLKKELELHADKVRKYICFHDTTSFEFKNEPNRYPNPWNGVMEKNGIWPAIQEFLDENSDWKIKERFTNNNGFTIIEKAK